MTHLPFVRAMGAASNSPAGAFDGDRAAHRVALLKTTTNGGQTDEALNHAVRQIVSKSVVSGGIVDIFSAAGMERPNLSVLSDEFLEDVQNLPYKNIAAAIRPCQKRSLAAAEIIQAIIETARSVIRPCGTLANRRFDVCADLQ